MATATDRETEFTPAQKQLLRKKLLAWYAKHARDLPWRRTSDPYHVWVSEIMLQQTQVATVRGYFERFVGELPTIERLAAADEQKVLRLWEGMGYYRRARQLHAAARRIVAEGGRRLPDTVEGLMQLPGIGRYTAGAIASIAFGRRAPILESNTIRLLARLVGYRGDVTKREGQQLLWHVAEAILPRERVAQFNQALMELGSLVCAPAEPRCGECPLADICEARAAGLQAAIPAPKSRTIYTELHEAAVVVHKNGTVLLRQCGDGERWAGLWDFPRFAVEAEGPQFARDEIVAKVREQTGVTCQPETHLKSIKHGVTRFRITLDCYQAAYQGGRVKRGGGPPVRWVELTQLTAYPLSTTGRLLTTMVMPVG
jgi:A/G-specific adenine glycosylase